MAQKSRPSFEDACRLYAQRFTMEHVPTWSKHPAPNGEYYAPQFRTDLEWFLNTKFPGELLDGPFLEDCCYSAGQTWPLGRWLDTPFRRRISYDDSAFF